MGAPAPVVGTTAEMYQGNQSALLLLFFEQLTKHGFKALEVWNTFVLTKFVRVKVVSQILWVLERGLPEGLD
jgi:hypothetical protein